ncbi:MAG: tetratricopeptide repeat protein [Chitinispirillaceae bacterium]|nr:tetratricopeptide repeat protein [Chitinispirillaceae bacterium]
MPEECVSTGGRVVMMRRYIGLRRCAVVISAAAACVLMNDCRASRKRPAATLPGEQARLSDAMTAVPARLQPPALLSLQLHRIVQEYRHSDSDSGMDADSSFNGTLDSAALFLSSRLFGESDAERIVNELNAVVFDRWGMAFDNDRNNLQYLFPHCAVAGKRGSCVGMSLLYLLLAEKTGLPLHGVLAPSHFFVRYDDGKTRLNIETLRKGECMSEAWYRQRYGITDTVLYPLRNLTAQEVVAVVHYNLGTICLNRRLYDAAAVYLRHAVSVMPYFCEARGNLALALDGQGESATALELLQALREKHPSLDHIDRNVASLQLKCCAYGDALESFTSACCLSPADAEAHYGRAAALYQLKRTEEAAAACETALALRPGYREARELMGRIAE